ncbi:hypothetical protein TNCV_4970571 [Trichonephila clavipes]|nr:hypothetical protein TNCV_4970571 [Trichonephila clavipes]
MMHFHHPCLEREFLDILLRRQWCTWWPTGKKICRQTKITTEEQLGWGIAGGLVSNTSVGKQEKGQFLPPVLLNTGYQEKEAVQNGLIEPLYHAVRLRMIRQLIFSDALITPRGSNGDVDGVVSWRTIESITPKLFSILEQYLKLSEQGLLKRASAFPCADPFLRRISTSYSCSPFIHLAI